MTPSRSGGLPAFFNLGDSLSASIELGLHSAIAGKMELAGVSRGNCVWGTSAIRTCDASDGANVLPYFALVAALLEEQLRPGDVVSLLGRDRRLRCDWPPRHPAQNSHAPSRAQRPLASRDGEASLLHTSAPVLRRPGGRTST